MNDKKIKKEDKEKGILESNKSEIERKDIKGESRWISPWRDTLERFFDENWLEPFERWPSQTLRKIAPAFPKVDISETDNEIKVTADIPGVDPDDVNIEADDNRLILSGQVAKEKEEGERGGKFYRYEREYGQFRREFNLPAKIRIDEIKAKAKNGVLVITLPKLGGKTKKKIEIDRE